MKRKEVEDVMGGKDSWENVDKADGECLRVLYLVPSLSQKSRRDLREESEKESGARDGSMHFSKSSLPNPPTTLKQSLPQPC